MIYTATTRYSILALARIASLEPGQRILVRDLAKETGIPRPFLGKILHRLARIDVLDSAKGHKGGFRLAKDRDSVTVADIVSTNRDSQMSMRCVLGLDECDDQQPCPMHDAWIVLRDRLNEGIHSMTIADLGRNLSAKRCQPRREPLRSSET